MLLGILFDSLRRAYDQCPRKHANPTLTPTIVSNWQARLEQQTRLRPPKEGPENAIQLSETCMKRQGRPSNCDKASKGYVILPPSQNSCFKFI